MRDLGPSSDANSGASASDGPPPSEPPPSSRRGFIGTNIDAAQAYVPPTALPDTPEPPVPNAKVALADTVDPRKAPTHPNLKKAAQVIASEMQAELASERPPPIVEAPPDSQSSGIRRGAGYAPSRETRQSLSRSAGSFPTPIIPAARPSSRDGRPVSTRDGRPASTRDGRSPPRPDPSPRKPSSTSSARSSSAPDAPETPAQRRAALALVFLFAALLAIAVYFFLRKAPSPGAAPPEPTGAASGRPGLQTVPSTSPTARAFTPAVATALTDVVGSSSAAASAASLSAPAPTSRASTPDLPDVPTAPAPSTSASTVPPTPPPTSAASTATDKPKTERWF